MTDAELMQNIKTQWGMLFNQVTASFPAVKPSFLAALTANETGGDPNASRFEPAVFGKLGRVVTGNLDSYGSITAAQLLEFAVPTADAPASIEMARFVFANNLTRLRDLATSWGLVQIMGYHAIAFDTPNGVADLKNPVSEIPLACRLLAQFADGNGLDLSTNFAELFACWNTGRPHGQTADPKYIPNGLARMQLYENL